MYFEDADLTREIRKYARAQYNPNFVVYHEWERAGSKQIKFFLIQVASMIKYMSKWKKQVSHEKDRLIGVKK
jgi:GT2 family glycosyltransferase